ncbi:hypothetical protein U472_03235 [Orenia metallireducens]|uniref:Uncharacterized protein n=1 Tax=Orenia metallireducens TaxID=1413210 RepID=A0A1C0AB36_9FIRM|nr:hypothetical protein [Orenia metallireducens]OCL27581.1 hypothetical protein U472_03235 [Orenia metallireducens]
MRVSRQAQKLIKQASERLKGNKNTNDSKVFNDLLNDLTEAIIKPTIRLLDKDISDKELKVFREDREALKVKLVNKYIEKARQEGEQETEELLLNSDDWINDYINFMIETKLEEKKLLLQDREKVNN